VYFNFIGGSALLHILAAHPKIVAVLGIAATVSMLSGPFGAPHALGAGGTAAQLEQEVAGSDLVDQGQLEIAIGEAARLSRLPRTDLEAAVRHALAECGRGCWELTPAVVVDDPDLLAAALYLAELDWVSESVSADAREQVAQLLASR
jgi:hypothetical protein